MLYLASYGDDLQQLSFDKFKTYKHFCIQNEVAETEYLRYTVQTLLRHILPPSALECKYVVCFTTLCIGVQVCSLFYHPLRWSASMKFVLPPDQCYFLLIILCIGIQLCILHYPVNQISTYTICPDHSTE